jgi:LCP family protein required for cell wall assembly
MAKRRAQHEAGAPAPVRLRRTWPQRAVLAFNASAIVVALLAAGGLAFAKQRIDQVPRIRVDGPGFTPARALASDAPRNILLVGADNSEDADPDAPEQAGRGSLVGVRSDTIMIVRLDPATEDAQILSFPRDLWVTIPGHGDAKINASLELGGGPLLIETIKANFDLDINSYVQVDFDGFKRLVEQVDGVPIYFDTPVGDGSSEGSSGLDVRTAGCTTLDGTGALQYVRSRYFYRVIDGRRVYDGTSDLGRISRQQDFIQRLMQRAVDKGARDPRVLASYLTIATEDIALDQDTTAQDLIDLGSVFRRFDPESLQTATVPSAANTRGGASVQDVLEREAAPLLARFRDPDPGQFTEAVAVAVAVSNGTGAQDEATIYATALAVPGFQTTVTADVPPVERTEVRYPPGAEAEATALASFLEADPIFIADPELASVQLVTGPDLGGVRAAPVEAAGPTTTTTTTTAETTDPTTDPGSAEDGEERELTPAEETAGYVPRVDPTGTCG